MQVSATIPSMWQQAKLRADFVLRCLGIVGTYALWLAFSAILLPSVRPHFLNLLKATWWSFENFKSTNLSGFISNDIVQPILLLVFFVVLLHKSHGGEAVKIHWEKEGIIGLKALGLLVVFWYFPIFLFRGTRIVWEDHYVLTQKVQALTKQNNDLTSENSSLGAQLSGAFQRAKAQCEKDKDDKINRLIRQRNTVCFNPDRHLEKWDIDTLFSDLKKTREAMELQHRTPVVRITGFDGDAETWRFVGQLQPIFENAGWTLDIPSPSGMAKWKTEHAEQEEWIKNHFPTEGVLVFDKGCPKCFGSSVSYALGRAGQWSDWTQYQALVKDLPHLEVLTVWIGYKPVLSR